AHRLIVSSVSALPCDDAGLLAAGGMIGAATSGPSWANSATGWADRVDYLDVRLDPALTMNTWKLSAFGAVPVCDATFVRPDGHVARVNPVGIPIDPDAPTAALDWWPGVPTDPATA
ncbi:hypothetical protein, partial [Nocardia cyriacigeorgica]